MAERKETGKKEDSSPQSDPLRGDGDAGTKRRSVDAGEDGSDSSAKKQKISASLSSKKTSYKPSADNKQNKDTQKIALTKSPIAMNLGSNMKPKEPDIKPSKSISVSKVFCDSSDDEEEEMPPEAKMRMRNLGRGTITSAGPNSFNKSREGFSNTGRAWRLKKEEEIAKAEHDRRVKKMNQFDGWDA